MRRDIFSTTWSGLADSRARLGACCLLTALAGALLGCLPQASSGSRKEPPASTTPSLEGPRNILLLTVDTLRADHLSAYGYPRSTSPTLDRLAAEGVRFEAASAQWPKTGPSFASIFTSTYPSDNGIVLHVGTELPCSFRMLAEVLRDQGYTNHAVVSNGAVASELRFDQGFDSYVETWKLPVSPGIDTNGAGFVTEQAMAALDRLQGDQPWFLWVHYLDPHYPYTPPEPDTNRFQDDEHFDPSVTFRVAEMPKQQMVEVGYQMVLEGRTELDFYIARYDAEIAHVDGQIDRLLGAMEQRGLLDTTVTAMTSDHGESLGDHHYFFDHGRFAFDTCQRVPLILHLPELIAPRVVETPVPLVDLTPTLLELAGVELPGGAFMQGRSLMPLLLGDQREPAGVVFAEAGIAPGGMWQHSVRDARFKLIYSPAEQEQMFIGGKGVKFTLYDLENDPSESRNVADRFPEELDRLRRLLWLHLNDEPFDARVDTATAGCEAGTGMDRETESQLKALGYL